MSIFIVKAGTGGALFRSLLADFLADSARVLDGRALPALQAVPKGSPNRGAGSPGAGLREVECVDTGEHHLVADLEQWIARQSA